MNANDIEVRLVLEAIYLRFHYDFRHYAFASMKRRLALAAEQLQCTSLSVLQDRLLHEPDFFPRLLPYLTIQVSEMFRDASVFKIFREQVCPILQTYPSLKLWVAGCSTGEEVYSYAVILKEEGLLDRTLLYATDINAAALHKAQSGVFPAERLLAYETAYAAAGGRARLRDYYTEGYGSAVFDRTLRAKMVFSDHSLATDTVFGEMHVVSCRNVLIYFDNVLQERALGLFKDALIRRGFLCLGSKETLSHSRHAPDFSSFAEPQRWYQRC